MEWNEGAGQVSMCLSFLHSLDITVEFLGPNLYRTQHQALVYSLYSSPPNRGKNTDWQSGSRLGRKTQGSRLKGEDEVKEGMSPERWF